MLRAFLGTLAALFGSVVLAGQDGSALESMMVRCSTSCEVLAASIRAFGGEVTFRYENVAALAATLPSDRLPDLLEIAGERAVWKDRLVPVPEAQDGSGSLDQRGSSTASLDGFEAASLDEEQVTQVASYHPDSFVSDNILTEAAALHSKGVLGAGVIVAVIDSGTANWSGVAALSESVAGGESLVDDKGPGKSATSRFNNPHGTQVATMIAAHGSFQFANTSTLVRSLTIHSPESLIPCLTALRLSCTNKSSSLVPMIGTAPGAKIYALKVVSSLEGGAPESRLVAAMDRVLTLRRNFNDGKPSVPIDGDGTENKPFKFDSLKIQVVNMSIGGPTLFAGQGLADELTLEMLEAGIVVVASAGNNGPAAMTVGSPGTGRGALTVGAASSYVHERVLRDVQFGIGSGMRIRPFGQHQMAPFSSRGPTADGRWSPDLVANGFASFAQGASGTLDLVSGTSFAAPTVAGAAALLISDVPGASPLEIRNALIRSANPSVLGDGSGRIDQGRGFIDIPAARDLLKSGSISSRLPRGVASERVIRNIKALGIRPVSFTDDQFVTRVQSLKPGQVAHFFVRTPRDVADFTIEVTEIEAEGPTNPDQQFCDNLLLHVVDAPTSFARTRVNTFIGAQKDANNDCLPGSDSTFTVAQPQPGLMRIALSGSSSNSRTVSATLTIERHRESRGRPTASGRVRQGDQIPVQVEVPAGTQQLTFDLSWDSHWGRYPTADIDLLLVDPGRPGVTNSTGATLDSPERVTVANPTPGLWTALVSAITIHQEVDDDDRDEHRHAHGTCTEKFELRATADGQRLPRLGPSQPSRRGSH